MAAAATNNAVGIAGVGYNARLLNVKIFMDDESDATAIAAGIYWAADHGAHVIHMSFNSPVDCASFGADVALQRQAVEDAWSRNIVLVASAGNAGNTARRTPASCPNVLAVANTDALDVINPSSSRGTWVDVAAPGSSVLTTVSPVPEKCLPLDFDSNYAYCSGTSEAAAVVSGLAALVRATCSAINQEVVNRIINTTDLIAGTGTHWQFGRVNAANAVCIPQPALSQTGSTPDSLSYSWTDRSTETFFQFWFRRYNTNDNWTILNKPADVTQQTMTGLQMGTWYEAYVRACDDRGCSEYSPQVVKRVNYFQLSVTRVGGGSVKSRPGGIDCRPRSSRCTAVFQAGTTIHLDAIGGLDPNTHQNWDFDHWEGACSGAGGSQTCTLQVSDPQPTQAIAVFNFVGND
jgi:hypothetical protein